MALTAQAQIITNYKGPPSSKAMNDKFAAMEPARILKGLSITTIAPGSYRVVAGTSDDESIFLLPNGVLCKFTTATLGTTAVDLFAADGTYKLVLRLAWASDEYQQPTLEMLTPAQSLVATSDLLLARFVKVGIAVTIFENRPAIALEQPFPMNKVASGVGVQQVVPFYFSTGQDAFGGGSTRYAVLPAGSTENAEADLIMPFGFDWGGQGEETFCLNVWCKPEYGVPPTTPPAAVRLTLRVLSVSKEHGFQQLTFTETIDLGSVDWITYFGGTYFFGKLYEDKDISDLLISEGGDWLTVRVEREGAHIEDTYTGELQLFAGYINAPWRKLGE